MNAHDESGRHSIERDLDPHYDGGRYFSVFDAMCERIHAGLPAGRHRKLDLTEARRLSAIAAAEIAAQA